MSLTYASAPNRRYLTPRHVSDQSTHSASSTSSSSSSTSSLKRPEHVVLELARKLCVDDRNINARNKDGDSFLMVACKSGFIQVVKFVIERSHSIDIDAITPGGWTALKYATRSAHIEIVEILVSAGADIQPFEDSHLDRARYLPNASGDRIKVLHAIKSGHAVYTSLLHSKLMTLLTPFDQLPVDLIPCISDYMIGENQLINRRKKATVSAAAAAAAAASEGEDEAAATEKDTQEKEVEHVESLDDDEAKAVNRQ